MRTISKHLNLPKITVQEIVTENSEKNGANGVNRWTNRQIRRELLNRVRDDLNFQLTQSLITALLMQNGSTLKTIN